MLDFGLRLVLELQNELKKSNRLVDDYNDTSALGTTRHERLLKVRELKKSLKSHKDDVHSNGDMENGRITSSETDNLEDLVNGIRANKIVSNGCESQNKRPSKQRLLVVANRLPVSAVRKGDSSWQLEVSAGGLVSALLGKCSVIFSHLLIEGNSIKELIFFLKA